MPDWFSYVAPVLTLVGGYLAARLTKPKVDAEARKLHAETDEIIVARLYRHIDRLDTEMKELREEFATLQKQADQREAELEQENRVLRAKVQRLEKRITGLERVFKVHPITPEMQAELDKLDGL